MRHHYENGTGSQKQSHPKKFQRRMEWWDFPELVTEAPRAWCNGIGRYTLSRWAVNQDDDVWLSMRGTRHQQKCGSCGLPGDTFPQGYYRPPSCESCIRASGTNVWSMAPWTLQLCVAYTAENSQDLLKAWTQEWDIMPAHDVACRACGCGDNTIDYWALDSLVCCPAHCCYCHSEALPCQPHYLPIGLPESQTCCHLHPYPRQLPAVVATRRGLLASAVCRS